MAGPPSLDTNPCTTLRPDPKSSRSPPLGPSPFSQTESKPNQATAQSHLNPRPTPKRDTRTQNPSPARPSPPPRCLLTTAPSHHHPAPPDVKNSPSIGQRHHPAWPLVVVTARSRLAASPAPPIKGAPACSPPPHYPSPPSQLSHRAMRSSTLLLLGGKHATAVVTARVTGTVELNPGILVPSSLLHPSHRPPLALTSPSVSLQGRRSHRRSCFGRELLRGKKPAGRGHCSSGGSPPDAPLGRRRPAAAPPPTPPSPASRQYF
nr:vegetative cell wall protein gp1-like [Lolium perenne]